MTTQSASTKPYSDQGEVTSDSADYRHTFYGILNAQGQFWTPLGFDSRKAAMDWLIAFVEKDRERYGSMLTTHQIVRVRIQLTTISETGA